LILIQKLSVNSHNFHAANFCEFVHSDQSNTALANLKMSALLIPWIKSTNNVHEETINKWSHDNTKHEICSAVLEDLKSKMLMPHCLAVKTESNRL
jgi:hypothetical protein